MANIKGTYIFWLFDATSKATNDRVCSRLQSQESVQECSVILSPSNTDSYQILCTAEFASSKDAEGWLKRVYAWYSIRGVEYTPLEDAQAETLSK